MNELTRILSAIERGDQQATEQLLPLVYNELRTLAAARLAGESPGHTLQATALVHEAYLRLTEGQARGSSPVAWDNRGHFFAAAAEAMRRILIDYARGKRRKKRGGDYKQVDLAKVELTVQADPDELLLLDEAISKLAADDPVAAQLVKYRYFAGLSVQEAAELLNISRSTAYDHWLYARAWLQNELYGPVRKGGS